MTPLVPSGTSTGLAGPGTRAPAARLQSVRRHNLALIMREVASTGPVSRAQLSVATGMTKATVSTLVETLRDGRLILEQPPERGMIGRPSSPLTVNPDGPVGLGLEVNVDYTAACLVDLRGAVRHRILVTQDNRGADPGEVLTTAARTADALAGRARQEGLPLAGVGIAVPGPVLDGVLKFAPNLPGWGDIPVRETIARELSPLRPVLLVDNEGNLAALGEFWYGQHGMLRDFVHVSGEIGVGGGVVVGGRLFRGARGFAGEIGHILVDPDGPACGCGSTGCVETLAGQEAVLRAAGVVGEAGTVTGDPDGAVAELLRRAWAGDVRTVAAIDVAGRALGTAVAAVVNLLDVPCVVLGGLYAQLDPWLRDGFTEELARRVVSSRWSPVEVIVSRLGPDAAVRGAAGTAVRRIFDDPTPFLAR